MFERFEEDAYLRAVEESIEQRSTPARVIQDMLDRIQQCENKILDLMKIDLTKPIQKPGWSPKKSNSSQISDNSLTSTGEILRKQDEDYRLLERQALLEQDEEEDEGDDLSNYDDLSAGDHEWDFLSTSTESGQEDEVEQNDDQSNNIIIKIQLSGETPEFSFPPQAIGQKVYDAVFQKYSAQISSGRNGFKLKDIFGKEILRDKTLQEQQIKNKTMFSIKEE